MQVFPSIDYFRLVAAILVVAIHTSPLAAINVTGDFVLTRILARVAVPFFFMATGFLLYNKEKKHLTRFIHKTLKLYIISIILYLPLNLYMGYFNENFTFWGLLKDLFINGTMYHLWYLPAAILGVLIAFIIMNKLSIRYALLFSLLLYIIGIFGDSYYFSISANPIGYEFYHFLFQFFDYTRNGIFFAPIFFSMGFLAGKHRSKLKTNRLWLCFIVSISFMVGEGLWLHFNYIQRHDSMYFMLIPSMYFLFQLLLSGENKGTVKVNTKGFRTISLVIYIIHPLVIVGVRLFAKVTGLTDLLINNSFIHFICVLTGSALIGTLIMKIKSRRNYYRKKLPA